MMIKYVSAENKTVEILIGTNPVTIGRAPEADIVIADEKASRIHCGIRIWDDDHFIRDLKSKNGTYVNNRKIEVAQIRPGDTIRIGSTVLTMDVEPVHGTDTALRKVEQQMSEGKGYNTILREIVDNPSSSP